MTGQTLFQVDQIGSVIRSLGDMHYVQDPLNGSDLLFAATDMVEKANQIVADYNRTQWALKSVLVYEKTVLLPGHIIGLRHPTGSDGPFLDPVWCLTPAGAVPKIEIEAEDLLEISTE